ncbi:hypothetical protein [Clostridium beijerinckii]|uniref:hypothetical protein n=1 Tax=Clostridium beijerinckii TaxID=1520 RepID=UPI00149427D7|nr:hypothetical protein [Clostridium beijerinckii]NOW07879.1 hypothetical protein [Clostridium beijerinckii]NYC05437.1 hypothetical protein [Clostridium beijerinckii]NYC05510.1 hypothetical protein [Clostridium beijerinckii]
MDKPLIIHLSFKTTSTKEIELYKKLYELEDRGNEIKQILGEIYCPKRYKRREKEHV